MHVKFLTGVDFGLVLVTILGGRVGINPNTTATNTIGHHDVVFRGTVDLVQSEVRFGESKSVR